MSDEELMTAYKNGDSEAFRLLYIKYSPRVYSYGKRRLKPQEADDFYQNFWKHLHEKRSLYDSQPFIPWFYVLIRNLLTDEYRARDRRRRLLNNAPEIEVMTNGEIEHLEDLLKTLPHHSETLIRKYYLEGHSYEELEKELGMSQPTLRKRLSRVMAQLKRLGGLNEQ